MLKIHDADSLILNIDIFRQLHRKGTALPFRSSRQRLDTFPVKGLQQPNEILAYKLNRAEQCI